MSKKIKVSKIDDKAFLKGFEDKIRYEMSQQYQYEKNSLINLIEGKVQNMRRTAEIKSREHVSNPGSSDLYGEATESCQKLKGAEELMNAIFYSFGSIPNAIQNPENRKR